MDPPTQQRDTFFLENYVPEAIEGAASSQTATLNFGRVKVSRKRVKKKDEQRRDKTIIAFARSSLLRVFSIDRDSTAIIIGKLLDISSSTPVHLRFLPAIDLHLDEPFAIADDRYHHPILFQHTPSRINTSVHLRDNLFNSPATPALMSIPDSEPLSSPETVLSTPQSTIFDWQPVWGQISLNQIVRSAHAQAIPKEVHHARKALCNLFSGEIVIKTLFEFDFSSNCNRAMI
ncbi:hypothetical protein BT96DRAFT_1003346 [Gymnopus androsaceus JB14]|uniref:Uncharacterized protein n=1 Tax=Gymnopus androsaceus JB14 TaxID=1447944 RepID=A0A6A4GUC2_9AGAR|nr:hypothetical protein BT96DRAFT_1003346 [Gymnopus androsaceus JB14]